MMLEFLEILKNKKKVRTKKEKLKWVSKISVWAEKKEEKNLESLAINFQKSQSDENFSKVIKELWEVKENYSFNKVFIVFPFKAQKVFKIVRRILEDEGFEPLFYFDHDITYSCSVLENIIKKIKDSTHILVIVSLADDEINKVDLRPNIFMEFGLGLGILGMQSALVLWDKRIERDILSDYEGWPRINFTLNKREWKDKFKSNLEKWRKFSEDY